MKKQGLFKCSFNFLQEKQFFIKTAPKYPARKCRDEWRKVFMEVVGGMPPAVFKLRNWESQFRSQLLRQLAGKYKAFPGCGGAPCGSTGKFTVFLLFLFLFSASISNTSAQSSEDSLNREIFFPNSKEKKYSIEFLPEWKSIEKGMDSQIVNLLNESKEIEIQLKLYRFNPVLFDIRVICSKKYGQKRIDVKTLAKLSGTVAIINSSYFDTKGDPLAYLRCNGKLINSKVASHSLYSGVFFVKQGRPYIVHAREFDPAIKVSDAVQVGPRLISKGKNTVGLKNIYAIHHRSGIALDRKRNVIIYATNSKYGGISWDTLRHILKLKKIGGYEVLNLDGGGSTQMYISTNNFEDYVRGMTPIPSTIAFFQKK